MSQKESDIEAKICDEARRLGFVPFKFTSPGNAGVSDRIMFGRRGLTVLIEVKDPKGVASKLQEEFTALLRGLGHHVEICDSVDSATKFMVSALKSHQGVGAPVKCIYKNWRGEVRERVIIPIGMVYGATEFHPIAQWLIEAIDPEDGVVKKFALKDFDFLGA